MLAQRLAVGSVHLIFPMATIGCVRMLWVHVLLNSLQSNVGLFQCRVWSG
jgi:hypothetical protein